MSIKPYIPPLGNSIDTAFPNVEPIYYVSPDGGTVPLALHNSLTNPYNPPAGSLIGIGFPNNGPFYYVPPLGNAISLEFAPKSGGDVEPALTQYLFPDHWLSEEIGTPNTFYRYKQYYAFGSDSMEFGRPSLRHSYRFVGPVGYDAARVGTAFIWNWYKDAFPSGIPSAQTGRPLIYNLLQIVSASGFTGRYGNAYVQGGVKYVSPAGYNAQGMPAPRVINVTETQYIKPAGAYTTVIAAPSVSPRSVYPIGVVTHSFGSILVERSPMPIGEDHSRYGLPTIWYHTRPLFIDGVSGYDTGYPRVFDPTQEIQTPSLIETGIFGDTRLKNTTEFIYATGIGVDSGNVPDYSYIENANRYITKLSFDSSQLGTTDIINKSPSISPAGIDSLAMPLGYIAHRIQIIQTYGFHTPKFGSPLLTKTPEILPRGIGAPALPSPTVWFKNRVIEHYGNLQQRFGQPVTWFRYRYVAASGYLSQVMPSPVITHGIRELIAGSSVNDKHGVPWVSAGQRVIDVKGIYKDFATGHMVGRKQDIAAQGFDSSAFGERIIPESQSVYPLGFVGTFGLSAAKLYIAYVTPNGFFSVGRQEADRWGKSVIYNLTQYIQQDFDINSGLVPPVLDGWTAIENKNKSIGITGFANQAFGYTAVDNNAEIIAPVGFYPPVSNATMVSSAVRFIGAESVEPPLISTWAAIYNDAFVIAPVGVNTERLDKPSAESTRRYYQWIGAIDAAQYGSPMIAYRIRTIDIEFRYSIGPPIISMPSVRLDTRYIEVAGFDTSSYGSTDWSIYRAIITTRWAHTERVGEPAVRNNTPELATHGSSHESYGNAHIRLQYRHLLAKGEQQQLFGLAGIADTTRNILVAGWHSLTIPQKHEVIRLGAPPYSEQKISLDGWFNDDGSYNRGFGIGRLPSEWHKDMGLPALNQNVIYVRSDRPQTSYGTALVRANSISIDSGINHHNVGSNTIVALSKRLIIQDGKPVDSMSEFGKPSLSPHTIWAVMDAPAQARQNHQSTALGLHYVDGYNGADPSRMVGYPTVINFNRSISTYNYYTQSTVPAPSLHNKLIVVKCTGIARPYFPSPSIPFGTQYIEVKQAAAHDSFARPALSIYKLNRELFAFGRDAQSFGATDTSNYNRYVSPTGIAALTMGSSVYKDTPYMWQGLRVGEHVPFTPDSDDMLRIGDAGVSLRVRGISTQGFNTFISDHDVANFKKRMTVKNGYTPTTGGKSLVAGGIYESKVSSLATITNHQQFIRPDGNSDQFRKGGYHA